MRRCTKNKVKKRRANVILQLHVFQLSCGFYVHFAFKDVTCAGKP